MSPSILKNNLCAGCGLCESVFGKDKIRISYNDEGFLRPKFEQNLNQKEQRLFEEVCPGISASHDKTIGHDRLWGPYTSILSGFATDENIRYSGSSGGGLTAMASYLLDQKKVDCVVHIGASEKHPYRNEYKISHTSADVLNNAGSRYAPSATLKNIVEIVENYSAIAIIGKPCDIKGIRNYMKKDKAANTKIKYLLSFMCAGVPSQIATKKIIEQFDIEEKDVASLRYRGEGWPGHFKIEDKQQRTHKMTYNESWGTVLNKHLQFRCKICADGTGEFADITCADAWESSENGYPSFEEKKGISLIIIRNEKGEKLVEQAKNANYITMLDKNFSSTEIAQMQPYQKQRKQNLLARLVALKISGRKIPAYNYNMLLKASLRENPLRLAKNFLGMLKRI